MKLWFKKEVRHVAAGLKSSFFAAISKIGIR